MRHTVAETLKTSSGTSETHNITYTYDNLSRLTGESATCSSPAGSYSEEYTYDVVGNRTYREVLANSVTLTTEYQYYTDGADKLEKETHTGPVACVPVGDTQYYAYAGTSGGLTYKTSGGAPIGKVKAFMLGLPNELAGYMLALMLICVPVSFFAPALARIIRRREQKGLSLYHRCLCVLLAYMMLISPAGLESVAQASSQYSQISTADWAGYKYIEYTYDDNGSCITKTTKNSSNTAVESVAYTYSLHNKLDTVTTDPITGNTVSVVEYTYNDEGIRVKAVSYDMPRGGGTHTNVITKTFLIDSQNHTGYAQVLEESDGTTRTTYTIGDDVITQCAGTTPKHLIYDGQGSTRQLTDSAGALITDQTFNYDAYGVMVGYSGTPQTNLRYTGEYYDTALKQYNLRARYYNPLNGRFNQVDAFAGNISDPISLHKYCYVHDNPVNGVDPTGLFKFSPGMLRLVKAFGVDMAIRIMIGIRATAVLGDEYQKTVNPLAKINRWIGIVSQMEPDQQWIREFMLRPDIVDVQNETVHEIKPDNPAGIALGEKQIDNYIDVLDVRYPGSFFRPGTWTPPQYSYELAHVPGIPGLSARIRTRNAGFGIIAYTVDPNPETIIATVVISYEVSKAISAKLADMARLEGHIGMATTLSVMGGF
jgi:RHS repeat-associated protein